MRGARSKIALAALVAGACAAGATAGGSAVTAAGPGYKVVGTFGKTGPGKLSGASGIDVASNGNVYVADLNNFRVAVFSAGGAFKDQWGSSGTGNGQFSNVRDVAVAPNGTVWAADDITSRAQGFSATGTYQSSLSIGNEYAARGVAVDGSSNVLVAAEDGDHSGFRVFAGGAGSGGPLLARGAAAARDIEASPDGTIFMTTGDAKVRRFSADGKPLGTFAITGGDGIGIDPDCNVWAADFPNRAITKYSPSGRKLATASSPDLQANDIAIARNGDLYVTTNDAGIVHFAENRAKPATAAVPGKITVSKGKATIKYSAVGIACPAQVDAVATLYGKGVSGRAAVQVAAGRTTAISMPVKVPAGKTTPATFKIVLKTNGRTTTETRKVTVSAK
jgi:secreted PhoX family phosphatase